MSTARKSPHRWGTLLFVVLATGCSGRTHDRVIVVGLDGATFDLIRPWAEQGKLPVLAGLLREGAHGDLASPIPPSSASAWTSAVTGVNPGKHGIYGFIKTSIPDGQGGRNTTFFTSRDRGAEPVWGTLGRAKKKVVLINIPLTSPPDSVAGVMISGFPYESEDDYAWPEALKHELLDYRLDAYGLEASPGHEGEFLTDIADVTDRREKITLRFLKEKDWDLFWVVFTSTDRVQHYFWQYMDPTHPRYEPGAPEAYRNAILSTYQRLDATLGKIIAGLDEHTTLLVISDHGFGPATREVMGEAFVEAIPKIAGVEAYTTDNFGAKFGVRPVPGTADGGATPPDSSAYEAVRKELIDRLEALEDPADGARVIDHVWRREELYSGPYLAEAPDVIGLENGVYLFVNWVPSEGALVQQGSGHFFSAFHRVNGILLARGPDVASGATITGAKLLDIAPTILALLGVPIPDNMDGRPLEGLFRSGWASRHRPGAQPAVAVVRTGSGGRNEALEQQLRSVGYIR